MAILVNYIDNEEEGCHPLKHKSCVSQEWPISSLSVGLSVKLH